MAVKDKSHVLIVGAGNFGAAAALALAREGNSVTLVDRTQYPNPGAASHDINKIVRDDYPDKLYAKILQDGMNKWRGEELYSRWYHQVGMLSADSRNSPKKIKRNSPKKIISSKMGHSNDLRSLSVEAVRETWSAFATANFDGLTRLVYNPSAGFARADKALGAVIDAAVAAGVEFVIGEVSRLNFQDDKDGKACTGITLSSGKTLEADKILLAAGACTASLLVKSDPTNELLHAGDRLIAAGALSFFTKVDEAQRNKLGQVPVLINSRVQGEGISVDGDGTAKVNFVGCYTNCVECPLTRRKISVVPDKDVFSDWNAQMPHNDLQKRAREVLDGLYGQEMAKLAIKKWRMCWDALTPTRDFLITRHPYSRRLYLATGGSFHGWKFLPVIGDYIARMMDGSLDPELTKRWGWDDKGRSGNPDVEAGYSIVGDMRELFAESSSDTELQDSK